MEGICSILGLCLIFLPVIIMVNYLLTHYKKNNEFDKHVSIMKNKKGKLGVIIAYLSRILVFITIMIFGFYMSDYFISEVALELFIIFLILSVIISYFDQKYKK